MNAKAEKHLQHIKNEFHKLVDLKYRKGQKEHGGILSEKSAEFLINAAIEEAIDQVVFLITLKNKISNPIPEAIFAQANPKQWTGFKTAEDHALSRPEGMPLGDRALQILQQTQKKREKIIEIKKKMDKAIEEMVQELYYPERHLDCSPKCGYPASVDKGIWMHVKGCQYYSGS